MEASVQAPQTSDNTNLIIGVVVFLIIVGVGIAIFFATRKEEEEKEEEEEEEEDEVVITQTDPEIIYAEAKAAAEAVYESDGLEAALDAAEDVYETYGEVFTDEISSRLEAVLEPPEPPSTEELYDEALAAARDYLVDNPDDVEGALDVAEDIYEGYGVDLESDVLVELRIDLTVDNNADFRSNVQVEINNISLEGGDFIEAVDNLAILFNVEYTDQQKMADLKSFYVNKITDILLNDTDSAFKDLIFEQNATIDDQKDLVNEVLPTLEPRVEGTIDDSLTSVYDSLTADDFDHIYLPPIKDSEGNVDATLVAQVKSDIRRDLDRFDVFLTQRIAELDSIDAQLNSLDQEDDSIRCPEDTEISDLNTNIEAITQTVSDELARVQEVVDRLVANLENAGVVVEEEYDAPETTPLFTDKAQAILDGIEIKKNACGYVRQFLEIKNEFDELYATVAGTGTVEEEGTVSTITNVPSGIVIGIDDQVNEIVDSFNNFVILIKQNFFDGQKNSEIEDTNGYVQTLSELVSDMQTLYDSLEQTSAGSRAGVKFKQIGFSVKGDDNVVLEVYNNFGGLQLDMEISKNQNAFATLVEGGKVRLSCEGSTNAFEITYDQVPLCNEGFAAFLFDLKCINGKIHIDKSVQISHDELKTRMYCEDFAGNHSSAATNASTDLYYVDGAIQGDNPYYEYDDNYYDPAEQGKMFKYVWLQEEEDADRSKREGIVYAPTNEEGYFQGVYKLKNSPNVKLYQIPEGGFIEYYKLEERNRAAILDYDDIVAGVSDAPVYTIRINGQGDVSFDPSDPARKSIQGKNYIAVDGSEVTGASVDEDIVNVEALPELKYIKIQNLNESVIEISTTFVDDNGNEYEDIDVGRADGLYQIAEGGSIIFEYDGTVIKVPYDKILLLSKLENGELYIPKIMIEKVENDSTVAIRRRTGSNRIPLNPDDPKIPNLYASYGESSDSFVDYSNKLKSNDKLINSSGLLEALGESDTKKVFTDVDGVAHFLAQMQLPADGSKEQFPERKYINIKNTSSVNLTIQTKYVRTEGTVSTKYADQTDIIKDSGGGSVLKPSLKDNDSGTYQILKGGEITLFYSTSKKVTISYDNIKPLTQKLEDGKWLIPSIVLLRKNDEVYQKGSPEVKVTNTIKDGSSYVNYSNNIRADGGDKLKVDSEALQYYGKPPRIIYSDSRTKSEPPSKQFRLKNKTGKKYTIKLNGTELDKDKTSTPVRIFDFPFSIMKVTGSDGLNSNTLTYSTVTKFDYDYKGTSEKNLPVIDIEIKKGTIIFKQ